VFRGIVVRPWVGRWDEAASAPGGGAIGAAKRKFACPLEKGFGANSAGRNVKAQGKRKRKSHPWAKGGRRKQIWGHRRKKKRGFGSKRGRCVGGNNGSKQGDQGRNGPGENENAIQKKTVIGYHRKPKKRAITLINPGACSMEAH